MSLSLIDHENGVSSQIWVFGTSVPGRGPGDRVPLAGSFVQEVARSRLPLILETEDETDLILRLPQMLPAFRSGLRSFLGVPLVDRDVVIGVLQIRSKTPGVYGQQHLDLAERIGTQIAGAIANSQMFSERTRLADENLAMAEIGRVISSSSDINEVYDRLGQEVQKLISFDRMGLVIIDSERATLTPTWVIGTEIPDRRSGDVIPFSGSLSEAVFLNKSPIMLEAENEENLSHWLPGLLTDFYAGLRSFLAVPLVHRDAVIGVLYIHSNEHGVYSQHHLDLAERIGNQIAGAIASAQLYHQTQQAEEAERQRSEELRESEMRFRQISENMREIVFLLDHQDHKVLYVNEAVEEIWGQSRESVYENPMIWIDAVHPDDRARVEAALNKQKTTGEFEEEFRIIRPDGTIRWIFDRAFPILNEVGEVYRLVGIAEDITERKQAEQRMNETARLASIGELAAGVAHEINNPLTSVLGYSEMLLTNKLAKDVSGDIQTIYDQAQRAAKIVQNLLFFARRRNAEKQYLDLNSVLNRSLEMKSYDFKVSNIEVVSHLSPEIRKTMVDEHHLVQVFLNILTNAEQAIHKVSAEGQIVVRTAISGEEIEITIKDDGPGIPSENLHRIFEPFFTTKEVGEGTGLGLSISFGIIKQHGGDIWAESVEGEGTTFHIALPVVVPGEIAVFQLTTSKLNGRTIKHLLVVDDEPHIRNLLRKYLELERYTVDLAEDGQEAWRKIQNINYDCILLDLKMPGMNGAELYELIQGISKPLASKVVFITGDTVSPETISFLDSTGNPVLNKPFSIPELEEQVLKAVLKSDDLVASTMPGGPGEKLNRQDMS